MTLFLVGFLVIAMLIFAFAADDALNRLKRIEAKLEEMQAEKKER